MAEFNSFAKLKEDPGFHGNHEKEANCFKYYERNSDGVLDTTEFHQMCLDLFAKDGETASLDQTTSRHIFDQFDDSKDGKLTKKAFRLLWKDWLPMILTPKSALIAVDLQNDFIYLPVPRTATIIPTINEILDTVTFDHVVFYTLDWHPVDHISFFENVAMREFHSSSKVQKEDAKIFGTVVFDGPIPIELTLYPTHCVQNSEGAALYKELKLVKDHTKIYKATNSEVDSFSAFFDNARVSQTNFAEELRSRRINDVYVCGISSEGCAKFTALDATQLGFRTAIVEDAFLGISEDGCRKAKEELIDAGCIFIHSTQVNSMVTACIRDPKLALKGAMHLAEERRK